MAKTRVGNKMNSFLNGEWAKHGRPWGKKLAAQRRRQLDKKIIRDDLRDFFIR